MPNNKLDIKLRRTEVADLEILFQFQLDKEANYLAAFTSKNSTNKSAYLTKYIELLKDPTINNQTIVVDNIIVGSVAKFEIKNEAEITY